MTTPTLRKLLRGGTARPWRATAGKGAATVVAADCAIYINVRRTPDEYNDDSVRRWQEDALLICAAVNEAEQLLDRVDELEGLLADHEVVGRVLADGTDKDRATIGQLRALVSDACDIADEQGYGHGDIPAQRRITDIRRAAGLEKEGQ
jgi:hypothetical protein